MEIKIFRKVITSNFREWPHTHQRIFTGFDTISTGLSWAVVYLVAYPEIQERLHEELSKSS